MSKKRDVDLKPRLATETFDPSLFDTLKKAEETHFWFRVRRRWILDRIHRFVPPPAQFLEVGCGTGNVSSYIANKGYAVTGCELHAEAIKRAWPGFTMVRGDAENLPFSGETFDIVGLFDVIEHFPDDRAPFREALRVLKRGGLIVLTVPAGQELWSGMDEMAFHKRRYTREMIHAILAENDLRPLLIEYMFMSLYLPMKYARTDAAPEGNPFAIHPWVNFLLEGLFSLERIFSSAVALPIGTSLLGIARKR